MTTLELLNDLVGNMATTLEVTESGVVSNDQLLELKNTACQIVRLSEEAISVMETR